jgi:hypothetical protein
MIHRIVTCLCVSALGAVIAANAAAKDTKPVLVKYQQAKGGDLGAFGGQLLHSFGYKDKKLKNGHWQVVGKTKTKGPDDAKYIAIYRSAEIAISENRKYIKLLSANGKDLLAHSGWELIPAVEYGTKYTIEFESSDTADSANHCGADVLRPTCRTIDAATAMQEIRPHLKF